jgi:TetR/AcrR family fatty acid metabolism transcriptional regulator
MSDIQILYPLMSKKATKKHLIIQAAIEVFSKNGFQNSSISEIAQRANVAEGTIYQYFRNKEDLFFSIPVEKTREFCRELDLHLEGIHGPLNKIRKFVWYYLHFFKANPEYSRTLMLEMRVSKNFVKTTTYKSFKNFTNRILEIIREGQEEGVIRTDVNIYLIRQLVLGILEHIVTRWLLKREKYDLLGHYDQVSKLVIDGISDTRKTGGLRSFSS